MNPNADELRELLEQLVKHCEKRKLTLFRGYINPEEHAVVDWDDSAGDLWVFLETASSIGAQMLYAHAFQFTEGDLEDDDEADDEPFSSDEERRQRIEAYRTRLGSLTMMTVMYRFDGVFHAWSRTALWYDDFLSLRDEGDEAEDENDDDEALQQKEEALLHEIATALANDSRFPDCRNQESRLGLLRRLRPDIHEVSPSEYGQRAIVREAQAIFDLDVRPKLRENPKERVLALQRQGFTVAQIAARVSLKASEVQRLLNENSSES